MSVLKKKLKAKKVCVVGSGNWATAIARVIASNVRRHEHLHDIVTMYVYEEIINGKKLSDIINEDHENVKYLPGYRLPHNLIAVPDVALAAKDADAIIFEIPHKYVRVICANLFGKIKPTAYAISMVKGFEKAKDGGIELISTVIQKLLRINVSVMMGATTATDIAEEIFTESVVGCSSKQISPLWCEIIETDYFRVNTTDDMTLVEVFGGLKNVIAIGAGIIDGLKYGLNTKATLIRLGILEMIAFVDVFYPGGRLSTIFESCGIADVITTCMRSTSRRIGEISTRSQKDIKTLETELLSGKQLRGAISAEEIHCMMRIKDVETRFPLMNAIYFICSGQLKPVQIIDAMKSHPETSLKLMNTLF